MLGATLAFWVAVLLLAHVYVGYPALLRAWAAARPRRPLPPNGKPAVTGEPAVTGVPMVSGEPMITVIVVAHDEARHIEARVANLLALDYPRDRLEIVIGSDGSRDRTAELARARAGGDAEVVAFEIRRGKAAVLNDLVSKARGEIVVLGDARQRYDAGALRALVRPFADPAVGAVSGELMLVADPDAPAVAGGVGAYWAYEKSIRRHESRVDSTIGATGAIYAIRRDLYRRIPEDTVLDDVLIPLRIARQGYRILFAADARAYDRATPSAAGELRRKARTIAGTFQLFAREGWLLDPRRNRLWFQTVSHKALRLLLPLLHLTALLANLPLAAQPLYRWTLAAQCLFYGAALGGWARRGARRRVRLLVLPYVVCLLSWATVAGFVRFVSGRQRVTWDRA
jgi:cellulose synthase/poly-beta-1,6-N-acetylglucosamine synthase-like glycosyltransferase